MVKATGKNGEMMEKSKTKKPKKPRLTYNEFLVKVKDYLEKHGKNGVMFVLNYGKWLDIYYTTHEQAYDELIKDERFKLEAGIMTADDVEARRAARSEKAKRTRQKKEEQKGV